MTKTITLSQLKAKVDRMLEAYGDLDVLLLAPDEDHVSGFSLVDVEIMQIPDPDTAGYVCISAATDYDDIIPA